MKVNPFAVLVALVMVAGLGMVASAAYSNDTALIQSNPTEGLVLDVVGNITSWDLSNIGDNVDSTSIYLHIRSNTNWMIQVVDNLDEGKPAESAGHMAEYTGLAYNTTDGGRYLFYPLQLKADPYDIYVDLSGTPQLLKQGAPTPPGVPVGGLYYNLTVNQRMRLADQRLTPPSVYRIIVTFIASNL
ncbi:MAG: hypothetical protein QFX32_06155 [Methanolinea sp.]|nr:hypothetical protein [Methanolinea sp.]